VNIIVRDVCYAMSRFFEETARTDADSNGGGEGREKRQGWTTTPSLLWGEAVNGPGSSNFWRKG